MKKLVMAIVATFIILMATNYVVHEIWLMPDYNLIPLSHRSAEGIARRFWAMLVAQFIFSVMFAYIYTRGRENKSWIEQGIRYGILIALLTAIPTALSEYTVYIIPYRLAIKWMVAGGIQMVLAALVVAAIYKDGATT
ncbi:MAG TPA: hypothetical protein VEX69_05080 [Candidatus Limnocylindria bacterium]|nr:hypothetical protein [Candidatus Limnocylindria bacterium]